MILTPFDRALGGKLDRKSRAGLAQAEKGLNLVLISVMNLVIIFSGVGDPLKESSRDEIDSM